MKAYLLLLSVFMFTYQGYAQDKLPIIDIHLHAFKADQQGPPPIALCSPIESFPAWDQARSYGEVWMEMLKNPPCDDPIWSPETDEELMDQTIAMMNKHNIYGMISGTPGMVQTWMNAEPDRFMAGLNFNLGSENYSVDSVRALHEAGRLDIFGEITNQYMGIEPGDERMDPYWQMAEELDIPVGIHIGTGPPGVIYLGAANYRARMHSALTLEEVLVKYPGLRVYIMHAGYPMLDDLLAVMYAHPQVYIDLSVIIFTQPKKAFYRYLEAILNAGFGERVMYGSDQMVWPEAIERSINTIKEAPFLTEEQKRDILYHNAARFLRLSEAEIDRHHER